MNPHIQSNIQKIAVPALIAIIALGAGYYAGRQVGRQEQDRALKEIFSGGIFSNGANLFGEVTAISSDKSSLIVKVVNVMGATLPKEYQEKTVLLTGDTKLVLRENKTPGALSEEMQKYQASIASAKVAKNAAVTAPPVPYFEKAITVGDLKVGDSINFSSSPVTGRNTHVLDNRFTAVEIFVTR